MERSHTPSVSQAGTTTVEFAIVGVLLFVVLFAIIEFGRALYVMNALAEATRRGARMAAVCPVGDPRPASVAIFDAGGGRSSLVYGLGTGNIVVEYLDAGGATIAAPAANFSSIHYVRVRITGFSLQLAIPTLKISLPMSGFSTTLPRESLGVPANEPIAAC